MQPERNHQERGKIGEPSLEERNGGESALCCAGLTILMCVAMIFTCTVRGNVVVIVSVQPR